MRFNSVLFSSSPRRATCSPSLRTRVSGSSSSSMVSDRTPPTNRASPDSTSSSTRELPGGKTAVEALQATSEHAVGNAEIPLSGFEPGNYRIQIKVVDQVANQTITDDFEFVLQ